MPSLKIFGRYGHAFFLGSATIVALGLLYGLIQSNTYQQSVISELEDSVRVANATIDPVAIEKFQATPSDESSPEYQQLRHQLIGLETIFTGDGVRGIYIMSVNGSRVAFIADSASTDDPWHSQPGEIYKEPPQAIFSVERSRKIQFTGPYTDEYGTYYSIFAPLRGPSGQIIAIIGADIEKEAFTRALWAQLIIPFILTLLGLAAFTTIFFIFLRRKENEELLEKHERELEEINIALMHEEENSENHRQRLEILIEQLPVGIFIVETKNGKPLMVNNKAMELLGKQVDPMCCKGEYVKTFNLVQQDGTPFPEEDLPLTQTLTSGKPTSASNIFVKHQNDKLIALRVVCVPVTDTNKNPTSVLVVFEDMTAEHDIDRQKTEFIYLASHELRTPLAVVKWYVEMLLDNSMGKLNKKQAGLASQIEDSNQHVITLVNELLNVSRLESGVMSVEPTQTNIADLFADVQKELEPLYQAKKLNVSSVIQPLPDVMVDQKLVREVLMNLLSNAIKYTEQRGKISIKMTVRKDDLYIQITDNGIGIPKNQQKNIFKKLFRAENAIARKVDGTGLGLYVTQQAIHLCGGEIGFESTEGMGTTFWFTLPKKGSKAQHGTKSIA